MLPLRVAVNQENAACSGRAEGLPDQGSSSSLRHLSPAPDVVEVPPPAHVSPEVAAAAAAAGIQVDADVRLYGLGFRA